jgi:transcriptional regulator with XRE-family HTH domain
MNVQKGIARAFEASGMNLTEFAKKAGATVTTAHGWINGTHGVKMKRLPKIAKALGVSVAELVA